MLIRLVITLTIFFSALKADRTQQGFYAQCIEEKKFIITSYNVTNGDSKRYAGGYNRYPNVSALKSEYIFIDSNKHNFSCKIGTLNIDVIFQLKKASLRGMCSLLPGGTVSLNINDREVIKKANMNISCYSSLDIIEFRIKGINNDDFSFRICGHSSNNEVSFEGCLTYDSKVFAKLPKTLGETPLNTLIVNLNENN